MAALVVAAGITSGCLRIGRRRWSYPGGVFQFKGEAVATFDKLIAQFEEEPLTRATLSALAAEGSNDIVIGFRPESLEIVGEDKGFPVLVDVVEELGMDAFAYSSIEDAGISAEDREIIVRVDAAHLPAKGERIYLHVHPEEQHAFSTKTGERLPV